MANGVSNCLQNIHTHIQVELLDDFLIFISNRNTISIKLRNIL